MRRLPRGNGAVKQTEELLNTLESGMANAQAIACCITGRLPKGEHELTLTFVMTLQKATQQTEALLNTLRHKEGG